ncbi:MAG: NAD-dependent epimerase/dehydratase family protein [Planctomycetaceae bacterium]
MNDALIGCTGFVGGTLLARRPFAAAYRSTTIDGIAGRTFDRIYCAGAPAEKWRANRDPAADRANLQRLVDAVSKAKARKLILISTVDVFGDPQRVTEHDEPAGATPYGRHRLELERTLAARFDTLIVRLPGLFGAGLKKNALYDLLHGNQVEKIDSRGTFQFYNVARLSHDLDAAEGASLRLVHLGTEPLTIGRVAREAFGREFVNVLPGQPAAYDVRTEHAAVFGRGGPYVADADEVLAGMRAFIAAERQVRKCA